MNHHPCLSASATHGQRGRLAPGQSSKLQGWLGAVMLVASVWAHGFTRVQSAPDVASGNVIALSALPTQGQDVYRRILNGGPFRYDKDGTVFGNRERLLPRQARGYYREYTVATPGSRDRGARRIVCGGEIVKKPETCFYTKDHYQSFQKIDPTR